jgi:uncharacterized membrane protein YcaP (DUF421 family)
MHAIGWIASLDWQTFWHNLSKFGAPDTPVSWQEKVIRPIIVYLFLVFGLKAIGKRVLAQLNPFDFVVLLTLSNTVQNAIIGNDTSLSGGLLGAIALLAINMALVSVFYRGPSKELLLKSDRDVSLIAGGQLDEREMRRLHINAGELLAKAHEHGFDSLDDVDTVMLYPNGTLYIKGKEMTGEGARFDEIIRRLDDLSIQVAALRR